MAKGRKGSKSNPIKIGELAAVAAELLENKRSFIITSASIKDDFCNYSLEITKGIGIGNSANFKGKHIIKDDLRDALARFNVHFAVLDDAFKYSDIEIEDIDSFHNHELTGNFFTTGFKISGGEGNETIELVGNKFCSQMGGRMEIYTQKVPLDNLSSYKWYNELKAVADQAREEVALYHEGKYTFIETEDDEPADDPNQVKMSFTVHTNDDDDDFAQAAL